MHLQKTKIKEGVMEVLHFYEVRHLLKHESYFELMYEKKNLW